MTVSRQQLRKRAPGITGRCRHRAASTTLAVTRRPGRSTDGYRLSTKIDSNDARPFGPSSRPSGAVDRTWPKDQVARREGHSRAEQLLQRPCDPIEIGVLCWQAAKMRQIAENHGQAEPRWGRKRGQRRTTPVPNPQTNRPGSRRFGTAILAPPLALLDAPWSCCTKWGVEAHADCCTADKAGSARTSG